MSKNQYQHPSLFDYDETRWHIWVKVYKNRRYIGYIRYSEDYAFECSAVKYAKKYFDHNDSNDEGVYSYMWVVAQTDPFCKKPVSRKKERCFASKPTKKLCIYCIHSRVGGDPTVCKKCIEHDRWEEVR